MPQSNLFSFGPLELVAAAFSLPLFSLVIALLVAGGILLVASRPRREDRGARQLLRTEQPDRFEPDTCPSTAPWASQRSRSSCCSRWRTWCAGTSSTCSISA